MLSDLFHKWSLINVSMCALFVSIDKFCSMSGGWGHLIFRKLKKKSKAKTQTIQYLPLEIRTEIISTILPDSIFEVCLRINLWFIILTIQFSSVAQSCPTLCDPMNCSTPGLPVHHQLPEFTQTHIHRVGDAIQPSHPLSSPSPPAP